MTRKPVDKVKKAAAAKAWQLANPEKHRAACKAYRERHPDRRAKTKRADFEKRREKHYEQSRAWKKDHPAARARIEAHRRAREQGAPGKWTDAECEALLEMYGHRCRNCGSPDDITIDHAIPMSGGGCNRLENLQPLCRSCNSAKRSSLWTWL